MYQMYFINSDNQTRWLFFSHIFNISNEYQYYISFLSVTNFLYLYLRFLFFFSMNKFKKCLQMITSQFFHPQKFKNLCFKMKLSPDSKSVNSPHEIWGGLKFFLACVVNQPVIRSNQLGPFVPRIAALPIEPYYSVAEDILGLLKVSEVNPGSTSRFLFLNYFFYQVIPIFRNHKQTNLGLFFFDPENCLIKKCKSILIT